MRQNDPVFDTWSNATIARDIQENLRLSLVASGKVSREQQQQEKQEPEEGVLKRTRIMMATKILTVKVKRKKRMTMITLNSKRERFP
jgi:hypothetical protein